MTTDKLPQSLRRLLLIVALLALLLGAGALALFAQEKTPPAAIPRSSPSTSSTDLSLLPLIPRASDKAPLPPGVTLRSAPAMLGDAPPSPDEFKLLYGYQGRYYNVANLDGHVAVVNQSVYVWPMVTWKASGLLRNQTRSDTHVNRLTARLLGKDGSLLATASANLFVNDLRPGEPGPFVIEAPIPSREIAAIDWQVEAGPSESVPRPFVIERDMRKVSLHNGLSYWLVGSLENDGTTTTSSVKAVVAVLDDQKRVRFVTSPVFRPYLDRPETVSSIDIATGATKFFTASLDAPWLPLYEQFHELAIWGVSK